MFLSITKVFKRTKEEEKTRKRKLRNSINNSSKPSSVKLHCAVAGVAVRHAAKETLEEDEVMDFGIWHLRKKTKMVNMIIRFELSVLFIFLLVLIINIYFTISLFL